MPRQRATSARAVSYGSAGGSSSGMVDGRFDAAQTLQLVMAERMTEEREKAISQVAESVGELAEVFKEIQVIN